MSSIWFTTGRASSLRAGRRDGLLSICRLLPCAPLCSPPETPSRPFATLVAFSPKALSTLLGCVLASACIAFLQQSPSAVVQLFLFLSQPPLPSFSVRVPTSGVDGIDADSERSSTRSRRQGSSRWSCRKSLSPPGKYTIHRSPLWLR